jgi:hypothetical protein
VSNVTLKQDGDMADTEIGEEQPQKLPSVDDVKPIEEGGPIARSGFNYQDEIAVSFLIEMLENPSILKVHCETHDDILLVRTANASVVRLAEFIQVKGSEQDKLWSFADLCACTKGKAGTSIFEKSLARDRHEEDSRFRIVTFRPVVSDLKILTFPRDNPARIPSGNRFRKLQAKLDSRFPSIKSMRGNGTAYWLENCLWDQGRSEDAVRIDNFNRLFRLSVKEGRPLLPEPADQLLDELRAWAKTAGDAKWEPDRTKKIITRQNIRELWEKRTNESASGAAAQSGGKLREKMAEAGLPDDLIDLATELRREYAAASRTSSYMEPEERKRIQQCVMSKVVSLRSNFVAGQFELDSIGFHSHCLAQMDSLNTKLSMGREDHSAFIKGCMYDIADRCLLRFVRPLK